MPCTGDRPLRPTSASSRGQSATVAVGGALSRPSAPAGSAVLAARAAMLSLAQEERQQAPEPPPQSSSTSAATSAEVSAVTASKVRQEELASEAAALSESFSQMEHKLFDFESGLADVLDRLDRLPSS